MKDDGIERMPATKHSIESLKITNKDDSLECWQYDDHAVIQIDERNDSAIIVLSQKQAKALVHFLQEQVLK